MYELRTDDDLAHLHATTDTLQAAITAMRELIADTGRQLVANGEGCEEYWIRLAIRDTETGEALYRIATGCNEPPTWRCPVEST